MPEPINLDSAAEPGAPVPFTFRGVTYELPPPARWPVGALDLISGGRLIEGLAEIIGEEIAERLVDDGLTIGHLTMLFGAATEAAEDGPRRKWWRHG